MDTDFAWGATKDFWQQEQSILAYYFMQGTEELKASKDEFLELARYCTAFWSLFFVDQDYRKIYFRTSEIGSTIIEGQYGIQAGHAIAGCHAFELCYLAHIYIKAYIDQPNNKHDNFILYYQPRTDNEITSLNVLPDFFLPGSLKVVVYKINGVEKKVDAKDCFDFQLTVEGIHENSIITV